METPVTCQQECRISYSGECEPDDSGATVETEATGTLQNNENKNGLDCDDGARAIQDIFR